ncbi:hypothetical protein N136_00430 [Leifsonia aquatica ATCC 14665]|uniref:Uncharacterized protein n=1 Tax=Leifsonia aquatica ATCC 14665 TaxID=1358026 RepID=U2T6X6_LEIAQ|nr:hypothetical protein N136_00430 [Leifsonia aquatica ATCC 14665]
MLVSMRTVIMSRRGALRVVVDGPDGFGHAFLRENDSDAISLQ